jgi:hypothetical protein
LMIFIGEPWPMNKTGMREVVMYFFRLHVR